MTQRRTNSTLAALAGETAAPAVKPRLDQRSAGILLHITSLPGPLGSGDLGRAARKLADFCVRAGLKWWQTLPITPIGPGNSPYSSWSAFAGNPLLIDLEPLVRAGWLTRDELRPPVGVRADRVRFAVVAAFRERCLRKAFERSRTSRKAARELECERFRSAARFWADDFALFAALRRAHGGKPWLAWSAKLRARNAAALREARQALREEIAFQEFSQTLFFNQWAELHAYCAARGVGLIGDIPIFVSHDSADVWAHQDLFRLDRAGRPTVLTGCPPDSFSATGQLWGHPHYDWARHARDGFGWWIERFRTTLSQFDAARIDHFLGFNQHWVVPAAARTAARGTYEKSPGRELFACVRHKLGELAIVAEDLGNVVPDAAALRDDCGFPGMRILQNGFYEGARYDQPHNYPRRCVAYTGTHDNDTVAGWFSGLSRARGADGLSTRERALRYLNCDARDIHRGMLRALYASPASVVIAPAQDIVGLDSRSRMNTPATTRGNWEWRMQPGLLGAHKAAWLRGLAQTFQR